MRKRLRKIVAVCSLSIFALSVSGCATVLGTPAATVAGPFSCTAAAVYHDGPSALLLAPVTIVVGVVYGFFHGLSSGYEMDKDFFDGRGNAYDDADLLLAPCW